MQEKIYEIIILIDKYIDNADSPYCYVDSYEEAVNIARTWVEQGYSVVLRTVTKEDSGHE